MKRAIKDLLGRMIYAMRLHRVFLRKTALIVLFHRVDDRLAGNPISCTTDDFRRYCEFFRRHFKVVELSELLRMLRDGKDVGGHVVITFDDGYRDNRLNAATELAKQGLPACFFIATNLIGSKTNPWWDRELDIRSEWMSWDEVRELRALGFEIGAHTMNHVDLGVVAGPDAVREISGSRQMLEAELDEPVSLFSYPYGRVNQLTEPNRNVVRASGFACCVSAFGGAVTADCDPFHLPREPISPWYLTPYQFGFEALFTPRGERAGMVSSP